MRRKKKDCNFAKDSKQKKKEKKRRIKRRKREVVVGGRDLRRKGTKVLCDASTVARKS